MSVKLQHRELVKKIAQNVRLDTKTVSTVLDGLHFAITDAISEEGDTVYVKNIGSFQLKRIAGKVDMLSGKPIKRDDKLRISFRPSKGLKIWNI